MSDSLKELDPEMNHSHESCDHQHPTKPLTKNEQKVYDLLCLNHKALKAYDILDHLKNQGVRAPMTVYRALEGLEHKGIVHKIESINAYVLCNHDHPHQTQVFLICDSCEEASEIPDKEQVINLGTTPQLGIRDVMQQVAETGKMRLRQATIELHGKCEKCIQPA